MEFHPLTDAQQSDALFQNYDERNIDKVGAAFRMPRLLRGDIRDFNRSCYSEDPETLTENGWKRVDEIDDGERVAAYDLVTNSVVYVVPTRKHVHKVDEYLSAHAGLSRPSRLEILDIGTTPRLHKDQHLKSVPSRLACRALRPLFLVGIADRRTASLRRGDINRVPYRGRVYCFSVPEYGFFVTRRNGKVAIQGNTALAALHLAEEQVFQPERQEFDFIFNRKLLADMGVPFWRFVSNAPVTRDPQVMAEIVRNLVTANVLTPEEGRYVVGDVFNIEFKSIKAAWVKQPLQLTLAGFPVESGAPGDSLGSTDTLDDDPDRRAIERFRRLKPAQMERETIYLPDAELASWLEPEQGAGTLDAREEPA